MSDQLWTYGKIFQRSPSRDFTKLPRTVRLAPLGLFENKLGIPPFAILHQTIFSPLNRKITQVPVHIQTLVLRSNPIQVLPLVEGTLGILISQAMDLNFINQESTIWKSKSVINYVLEHNFTNTGASPPVQLIKFKFYCHRSNRCYDRFTKTTHNLFSLSENRTHNSPTYYSFGLHTQQQIIVIS